MLAWCELSRSGGWLAETVDGLRRKEREALVVLHEGRLSSGDEDTVVALLDGLRAAVCASRSPMPPERARDLLRGVWEAALAGAS